MNRTDRKPAPKLEAVALAGAFGSHIDVKYAMVLGLIPDCDLRQVTGVGNAAGAGARLALLNLDKRRHIEALVTRIEKIETAVEPLFQQHFVEAMALPHKTAPFPHLREAVALPEPFAIAEAEGKTQAAADGIAACSGLTEWRAKTSLRPALPLSSAFLYECNA